MMKIWTYIECGDDGPYPSVHLTEKGCLVAAIETICEVLGFSNQDEYEDWIVNSTPWSNNPKRLMDDVFPVDQSRTAKQLWQIYDHLSDYTWDCDGFDIEVRSTTMLP